MLHLQARVHLHKEKLHGLRLVVAALLDDEFHRARTHIVHRARCGYGRSAHALAQGLAHAGGGRFFQHFLVPALHRAVALKQIDAVPMRIGKHLNLNVARALHIFFDQDRIVAKTVFRFALAGSQCSGEISSLLHHAHAFTATACAGLDQHRVAYAIGRCPQYLRVLVRAVVARHQGHA